MDWKQIKEKVEMVINANRQNNTVKMSVDGVIKVEPWDGKFYFERIGGKEDARRI